MQYLLLQDKYNQNDKYGYRSNFQVHAHQKLKDVLQAGPVQT